MNILGSIGCHQTCFIFVSLDFSILLPPMVLYLRVITKYENAKKIAKCSRTLEQKRRISDVWSERNGNSEVNTAVGNEPSSPHHENISFGTEPTTSAQQISANAEMMKAEINIDIELVIGSFFDRKVFRLSDETKYNLLKRPFKTQL